MAKIQIHKPKIQIPKNIKNIKKKCSELEKNIKEMKNTYPWVWAEQNDSATKEHIINSFVESRHKN